jgi:hypothetical protein
MSHKRQSRVSQPLQKNEATDYMVSKHVSSVNRRNDVIVITDFPLRAYPTLILIKDINRRSGGNIATTGNMT